MWTAEKGVSLSTRVQVGQRGSSPRLWQEVHRGFAGR